MSTIVNLKKDVSPYIKAIEVKSAKYTIDEKIMLNWKILPM